MFHKILVPVDESTCSQKAVSVAIDLAKQYHSLICLLHAFPHIPDHLGSPIYEELIEKCTAHGTDLLETTCEEIGHEVPVETQLIEGSPAESILRVAETEGFDLIVMGCRGHGPLRNFFVGSVSQAVSRKSPCPVVVVH